MDRASARLFNFTMFRAQKQANMNIDFLSKLLPLWKAIEKQVHRAQMPVDSKTPDSNCDRISRALFDHANVYRRSNGLRPLAWNLKLCAAAKGHAQKMAISGEFGHVLSDGVDMGERVTRCGFDYLMVRENIAWIEDSSLTLDGFATHIHVMWVNSPPHRESLLAMDVTHLGVAVVRRCRRYYAVQNFGRPKYPIFERGVPALTHPSI